MHKPLAEQHRWFSSVLRGHYGYFGMPHNWRPMNRFLQEVRRIWFNCLQAAEPEEPANGLGLVRDCDRALAPTPTAGHSSHGHHARHEAG